MESFLTTARDGDRIRVVVVGCSIGRGVGDELSDIDALIGVRVDAWEAARADVWRIWAVAEGVPDAQYGVTAVFDDSRRPKPAGMSRTIASLEKRSLVAAAIACCDIAIEAWPRAMAAIGASDGALPPLAS